MMMRWMCGRRHERWTDMNRQHLYWRRPEARGGHSHRGTPCLLTLCGWPEQADPLGLNRQIYFKNSTQIHFQNLDTNRTPCLRSPYGPPESPYPQPLTRCKFYLSIGPIPLSLASLILLFTNTEHLLVCMQFRMCEAKPRQIFCAMSSICLYMNTFAIMSKQLKMDFGEIVDEKGHIVGSFLTMSISPKHKGVMWRF